MPDKSNDPFNFWNELKRRKVIRVITVYGAAAFVIIELINNITGPLSLPEWIPTLVIVLLSIGFLIAIVISWIFDITPEGIQKTEPKSQVRTSEKQDASRGWKISTYISGLVIVAFIAFYIIGNIKQSSDIYKLEKSIAVLPFENFTYGEEYSHYGNSIANEITTELSNIKEFHVVSNTSSSQYMPGNKPPIPQIGRELGVNFIIEGSFERQGDKVNIHVQIIQANKDYHLRAREFDGMWKDIHSIQDDIAYTIANELQTLLSPEEIEQIEKKPTENLDAWEYYLRGIDYYSRSYSERDWRTALNNYEKAIELDPNFALAYIGIAKCHIFMKWYRFGPKGEHLNKCRQAIDAAFSLNPSIPEGYIALGLYYYWGYLDYTEALKQFEIALQIMPNNNDCLYYMSCVYRRMGELTKSAKRMKEALNYDPKNHRIAHNLGQTYDYLGEYSVALEYFDLSINLKPDFFDPYSRKARLFLKWEGNTINARKTLDEASLILNLSDNPVLIECAVNLDIYDGHFNQALNFLNTTNFEAVNSGFTYFPNPLLHAKIYDIMGDSEQAGRYYNLSRIVLEEKILENPDDPRYYRSIGICYARLGQKDKALEAGRKAVELIPISKERIQGVYLLGELARIYVMVGEYELALNELDYVLTIGGFLSAKLIQLDPDWKPLWDLPEFKQLMEKYSDN